MKLMNGTREISKEDIGVFINEYMNTFDATESARVILEKGSGIRVDDSIAKIVGISLLRDKRIQRKIDEELLKNKITPDNIKLDAYKMSKVDSDGRVRIKALELIARSLGMYSDVNINQFNVNHLTWQQLIVQAHKNKRVEEIRNKEITSGAGA